MTTRIIRGAFVMAAAYLFPQPAWSQAARSVPLRSGRLILSDATTEQFVRRARSTRNGIHGVALLQHRPSRADRERLAANGLLLLTRLTPTAYLVRAAPTVRLRDTAVATRIRFLSPLEPRSRVAPEIWNRRFGAFADRTTRPPRNLVLNRDSTLNLLVRFHEDVPDPDAARALRQHRTAQRINKGLWRVTTTRASVDGIAANDIVRWIDVFLPRERRPDLDLVRDALRLPEIQGFDPVLGVATDLTGANIRVGVYDSGIDAAHPDFGSPGGLNRIVDRPEAGSHGTYVAGIIAGNGTHSIGTDSWGLANEGFSYQWRGIAPASELIDADEVRTSLASNAPTLRGHVTLQGMDVSNHSYWLTTDGHYEDVNALHDALIRGDDAGDGSSVPARLHVHSAGNFGTNPAYGDQRAFFSLGNQLKNALVVGSYYVDAARIAKTSSLGPTHDGRIKPDVVAPGSFVIAPGYCTQTDNPPYHASPTADEARPCDGLPAGKTFPRRDFYFPQSGTSTASAATTGVLALVLQEYVNKFGVDLSIKPPLPSTLRGIVIHSATDRAADVPWFYTNDAGAGTLPVQAFPGPDFVSGFGLVDAAAAVDVVRRHAVREDVIEATCQTKPFILDVGDGAASPVKVTLAWDDPASDVPEVAADQPRLINDLDLVLTDPTGAKHYPWLLDQGVTDAAGASLSNDAQTCGMDVVVKRKILPTATPHFAGLTESGADVPGGTDDPIAAADLGPATTGKDHLNNVEQVVAPAIPGRWTIEVSGFALDAGPQRFSLIGVPPRWILPFGPLEICRRFAWLCDFRILPVCHRYPPLCKKNDFVWVRDHALEITFRDLSDRKVIELSALCHALDATRTCLGDSAARGRPTLDLTLGPGPVSVGLEVFDSEGRMLGRDLGEARAKRLRIPRHAGPVFLFIRPGAGAEPKVQYSFPIALRRAP